jgi:uncharacterized protein (TIGR02453 family)
MIQAFSGFQPETLEFLRDLGENNTKVWFDAHRGEYERDYLAPGLAFIAAMDAPLRRLNPTVHADPRVNGSLFRINRDVRFSRDKTPYKDHLDLFFWVGEGRSRDRPGFFFRLRADRLILGAGIHAFDARMLEAFRASVLDAGRGTALETAASEAEGAGASVEGVGYRRVPAGFDNVHPRAAFLRHNALHASFDEPVPSTISTPSFVDHCLTRFRPLASLLAWVAEL